MFDLIGKALSAFNPFGGLVSGAINLYSSERSARMMESSMRRADESARLQREATARENAKIRDQQQKIAEQQAAANRRLEQGRVRSNRSRVRGSIWGFQEAPQPQVNLSSKLG